MLLADIRDAFAGNGCDSMSSKGLVSALTALTERPWGECSHGKALTPNQLAQKLKPFNIFPKTVRIDGALAKGYLLESFSDAFSRYILVVQTVTPTQVDKINDLRENQTITRPTDVTIQNPLNGQGEKGGELVADETRPSGNDETPIGGWECEI